MSDNLAEWRRLRIELGAIYDSAEGRGDKDAMRRAEELTRQADQAMARASLEDLRGVAEELADITKDIEKATSIAKQWSPFQDIENEIRRSFRGDVADNDYLDESPEPDSAPSMPADASSVPVVSHKWSENYQTLWDTMTVSDAWKEMATGIVTKLVKNQSRYAAVVAGTTIPWWFIAVVHSMEAGMNFNRHLHNGDPLTSRTVREPKNLPVVPDPPYSWEVSAEDSLRYERLDKVTDWSLPSVLYHWHRYNGIGNEYKRRGIPTPYLWSGSQHYVKGKYVRDHEFDPNARSDQVGAAVLLKVMIDMNVVQPFKVGGQLKSNPKTAAGDARVLELSLKDGWASYVKTELTVPKGVVQGTKDDSGQLGVRRLQEWLTVANFVTPVDGDFGNSTQSQLAKFKIANGRAADASLNDELWSLLTAPMLRALAPVGFSSTTPLEEAVLRVAAQHIAQQPCELGGDNCGPWVRLYMAGKQGKDWKWCAGFVCFIVFQAAKELGLPMPFPRQVGVDALVQDAKNTGRFIKGTSLSSAAARRSKVRPGSLFVIRETENDWTHVGIVLNVNDTTIDTLEGNTGGSGGVDGADARRLNRSVDGKDFISLF
ncbi:CHAP domain-containing protein [Rhizobium mongolense]|uniref:Lysozyme family protein n=2 Tax=Rhizobium mongolense TaxID=57676 RepID=A0ABR6IN65_9HYPH|nr:CHAP domain-containing protein [Rhizobium mongolense]MBB4229333.1 lysozyme family protein [Rhizobium mongolense]TVZ63121.1 lysozyme family protein [Rhizobium mongolense USDA 1844]